MLKLILGFAVYALLAVTSALAVDFSFSPDTTGGNIGDTVTFIGRIGPSTSMRSFTIYLGYDTNAIKLAAAPTAGSLVASRQGLRFFYYDHIATFPDRLDIGAAVYSTDYWSGPGDLFRVRFVLRHCGDIDIADPYFPRFTAPDGSTMPWGFDTAVVQICPRVPGAPTHVTIHPLSNQVRLHWDPVTRDTLGRVLFSPVSYAVFREQLRPNHLAPIQIIELNGTSFIDSSALNTSCRYYIIARCLATNHSTILDNH